MDLRQGTRVARFRQETGVSIEFALTCMLNYQQPNDDRGLYKTMRQIGHHNICALLSDIDENFILLEPSPPEYIKTILEKFGLPSSPIPDILVKHEVACYYNKQTGLEMTGTLAEQEENLKKIANGQDYERKVITTWQTIEVGTTTRDPWVMYNRKIAKGYDHVIIVTVCERPEIIGDLEFYNFKDAYLQAIKNFAFRMNTFFEQEYGLNHYELNRASEYATDPFGVLPDRGRQPDNDHWDKVMQMVKDTTNLRPLEPFTVASMGVPPIKPDRVTYLRHWYPLQTEGLLIETTDIESVFSTIKVGRKFIPARDKCNIAHWTDTMGYTLAIIMKSAVEEAVKNLVVKDTSGNENHNRVFAKTWFAQPDKLFGHNQKPTATREDLKIEAKGRSPIGCTDFLDTFVDNYMADSGITIAEPPKYDGKKFDQTGEVENSTYCVWRRYAKTLAFAHIDAIQNASQRVTETVTVEAKNELLKEHGLMDAAQKAKVALIIPYWSRGRRDGKAFTKLFGFCLRSETHVKSSKDGGDIPEITIMFSENALECASNYTVLEAEVLGKPVMLYIKGCRAHIKHASWFMDAKDVMVNIMSMITEKCVNITNDDGSRSIFPSELFREIVKYQRELVVVDTWAVWIMMQTILNDSPSEGMGAACTIACQAWQGRLAGWKPLLRNCKKYVDKLTKSPNGLLAQVYLDAAFKLVENRDFDGKTEFWYMKPEEVRRVFKLNTDVKQL